jgi:hypothetical protein
MPRNDQSSHHGPPWTKDTFLAANSPSDCSRAERLFQANETLTESYYRFGQQPSGGVFLHPLGLRYAPMSLHIDDIGFTGRGTWNRYPEIKKHVAFSDFADFVGLNHLGPASAFPIAEFDVEQLWSITLECAHRINNLR